MSNVFDGTRNVALPDSFNSKQVLVTASPVLFCPQLGTGVITWVPKDSPKVEHSNEKLQRSCVLRVR
jgi:hypothetical protein